MSITNNSEGKNQNFISHFVVIGGGTVIGMLLSLLTTPIITRIVDPTEYGQFSIFNMYVSIGLMVLCIGLDQALVRFFYNEDGNGSEKQLQYRRALVKICFCIPCLVSIIVLSIFVLLCFLDIISFEFSNEVVVLLGIQIVLSIWNRIAILLLRITYQSKRYSMCNIAQKLVNILCVLLLIKTVNSHYLIILIMAGIVSMMASTLYAVFFTREYWRFKKVPILPNKREIIRYGMPFILSMGITTIFQAMDKMALNRFCTYAEVGVYSSAMSIVNIFAIVQSTFNALWGPMQVEHYVKNPNDKSFIKKGNSFITIIMFFIGINLIFFKDIFVILLGEKYREAAYILPFLIFNPIMYTISETTCSGIGVSKKSYINIIVSLGACITNATGNILLVPRLGCQGAAISTGISYIVFWCLRTWFSNKYYYVDYQLKKFAVLTLAVIGFAMYNTFNPFSYITVIGYVICCGLLLLLYWRQICAMMQSLKLQLVQIFNR